MGITFGHVGFGDIALIFNATTELNGVRWETSVFSETVLVETVKILKCQYQLT